jgi:hypothetical protein
MKHFALFLAVGLLASALAGPAAATVTVSQLRRAPLLLAGITGVSESRISAGNELTGMHAFVGYRDALVPMSLLDRIDVSTHRYDPAGRTIEVRYSGITFLFTLDSDTALRNGAPIRLDIAPTVHLGSVLLPIADLAREFQADLDLADAFTLSIPTVVPHPTLVWTGDIYRSGRPLDYRVQVARDKEFTKIVITDTVAMTGQYVPRQPLPPGDYWWRVKPVIDTNSKLGWQNSRHFRIIRPAKEVSIAVGASARDIHEKLQEAANHSPAVVTFEKGDYAVAPNFDYLAVKKNPGQWGGGINSAPLFELVGAKNVIIDGQGSRFVLEDDTSICKFLACRNIVLKNASFTTPMPLKPAGKVLSVDTAHRKFTIRVLEGFPTPDDKPHYYRAYQEGFGIFDEKGAVWRNAPTRMRFKDVPRKEADRHYAFSFSDEEKNAADLPVGAIVAFVPKQGGAYGTMCLMTDYCEDITFQNIRKYGNGGYNFMCHYTDRLKFLDLVEKPESPFGRNEGGLILSGRAGAWLDGYEVHNTFDDGFQYSTNVSNIVSRPAPNKLILRQFQEIHGLHDLPDVHFEIGKHWRFNDFRVGDELFIYTSHKRPTARFKITDLQPHGNRTFIVTLDHDMPEDMPFVIEKASFPNGLTVVVNLTGVQSGAAYRNSKFINIARNSIYGAASNFLIERCEFQNIGEDALRVADFALADYSNILIRKNTIANGNLNRYSHTAISIGTLMYERAHSHFGSVSNVFIEDNQILDANNSIFGIWATDRVFIRRNSIRNVLHADFGRSDWSPDTNKLLFATDCGLVSFENNTVADDRGFANPPFALRNTATFLAAGNKYASGSTGVGRREGFFGRLGGRWQPRGDTLDATTLPVRLLSPWKTEELAEIKRIFANRKLLPLNTKGLLVTEIAPGVETPLKPLDLIVAIGDTKLTGSGTVTSSLGAIQGRPTVDVTVLRLQKPQDGTLSWSLLPISTSTMAVLQQATPTGPASALDGTTTPPSDR